jgi:hypothetical protein
MEAVRMDAGESITLDGRLDEDVWLRAAPATNFIQRDPVNGQPATEQTEVRIVYNADKLYMGVTCFDSEPEKWMGVQLLRDGGLPADDKIQWTIDTFLDGRTGYFFEMNPLGSMADALQGADDSSNRQWDGIWNARAHRSEIGWTLEIEIPFRTLNFNPDSDTWGINFQRTVARKNEESLWMGWPRNQGLRRMSNAGLLTGIRNVTQGHGLDIKPYLLGTLESFPGRGNSRINIDRAAGVDFFYSVTPGLRANLTVNTDFAQAEVDQRQVNLTRFSLLFPEKRDFFLDGALFLDFASGGTSDRDIRREGGSDLLPFFSRRIGLDARGMPQRINFGGKLTGQLGEHDIGVLQVQTGEDDEAPGEDFTVMRIKRRMLQQSYVGALYTLRHVRAAGSDNRQTIGVDFRLATSNFRGSQNLQTSGYFLHGINPLSTGKNSAFGAELSYPNDPFEANFEYMEIQDNYDAAVGYTRRTGFRKFQPRIGFGPRPRQHPWIRRFNFVGDLDWRLDSNTSQTLTRELDVTVFQLETHPQDEFQIHVIPTYEQLEQTFPIAPGVTLPAGRHYSFTRYSVQAETSRRRLFSLLPSVEWGDFYSGQRLRLNMSVDIRARAGVLLSLAHEWNRVSLAEGQFYTRLYRFISETQFNPFISLVNNVQYETQSAVLGWQARLRWIIQPGNDLYFVYIHNWQDDPLSRRIYTLDRRATSKISYTHRF